MDKMDRPRFDQNTGERIIYDDEVMDGGAPTEPTLEPLEPIEEVAPIQTGNVEQTQAVTPEQTPVSPVQQPGQVQPVKQKSGCGGCLKGCLITLIIFIVLVGLLIGGGYAIYKMNQPKDVKFSESDVESFYDKIGIDNKDYLPSVEEILAGEAMPSGELKIDDSFTSAEVTAVIQDASGRNDYFQDVNVRFIGEDKVEVFATVSEEIDGLYEVAPDLKNYEFVMDKLKGQQLYYVGNVEYDQTNGFQLEVEELKVGLFKIPADMINEYDTTVESLLNSTMTNIGGFGIESMKINEDSLDFVGTIPEKLK